MAHANHMYPMRESLSAIKKKTCFILYIYIYILYIYKTYYNKLYILIKLNIIE